MTIYVFYSFRGLQVTFPINGEIFHMRLSWHFQPILKLWLSFGKRISSKNLRYNITRYQMEPLYIGSGREARILH